MKRTTFMPLRKVLLLTLMLVITNNLLFAQSNEEITLPEVFPTEDAEWVIEEECRVDRHWANPETGLWYDISYTYYSYYLQGDTIIDGNAYSKLLAKDITNNTYVYVGGIRVEGEKVYFNPYDIREIGTGYESPEPELGEFCLYDFSLLEEGGEFCYPEVVGFNIKGGIPYFYAIGWFCEECGWYEWKRGIGSVNAGLWYDKLTGITGLTGKEYFYRLKAYYYKGKQFYPETESGIKEEIQNNQNDIAKVVAENSVIRVEREVNNQSLKLFLYNQQGIMVKEAELSNAITQISTEDLPQGVYIYRVEGEDVSQGGKIVIR